MASTDTQPTLTLESGSALVSWPDGCEGQFPFVWLRDADPSGFHPDTRERTFDLTSIRLDLEPIKVELSSNCLQVHWEDRPGPSCFDLEWLKNHRPGQQRPDPADISPIVWRSDILSDGIPRHDAKSVTDSDSALLKFLVDTKQYGLSIVTDLENCKNAGTDVGKRVAHLRETNFGLTFEVMSKPDPNNLAYTSEALPLHTDLANQELPPGFQFLHCIANEAEGGGSIFCNGIAVAEDLRIRDPAAFKILTTVTVPFRFHDNDSDLRYRKTIICLDHKSRVCEICFNAHLADILDLEPSQMIPFYHAYQMFMKMTRDPAYVISLRLRAGEMAVFDNRSTLHGREKFNPSTGFRHLHGFYVDRGDWDSRIRVLSR